MHRGLLGLVSKKRNLLFAPMDINLFANSNEISWFTHLLNIVTTKHNFRNFKDIIGSSNNAIIALLLGLGYTIKEIQQKLNEIPFQQAVSNSGKKIYQPLSIMLDTKTSAINTESISKQFKLSTKDSFLMWAQKQISNKLTNPMATFENLNTEAKKQTCFKNIHLIGLNIETGKLEIFNCKNTPNMPIAIAARICMSCSTIFSIVEIIDSTTREKNVYADGGLVLQHIDFSKYKIAC